MEWGPRALGGRSIIADARSPKMQKLVNLKIKFRESFRPFAPSVRYEDASAYFDIDRESPYMLLVAFVRENKIKNRPQNNAAVGFAKLDIERSEISAVTHVDYSARLHTVRQDTNPLYHEMLSVMKEKYNCPVVINTSFNVRGEPIVCTPQDALNCFLNTEMDYLVIGNHIVVKAENKNLAHTAHYHTKYELD